jgi:hypothetical protein
MLTYENDVRVWNFKFLLAQKYEVVVTNPPYMAPAPFQADWVKANYPDRKSDVFAAFIERCEMFLTPNGYQAMITQHSWMFLSSYEKLRGKLMHRDTVNMAHLGARAFAEISGEVVQTTAFVMHGRHIGGYKGVYVRLVDINDAEKKEHEFLSGNHRYTADSANFAKIPGSPVAYWVSENSLKNYDIFNLLKSIVITKQGFKTGDNDRFLRLWFEIQTNAFSIFGGQMWFPCNKGGDFRKWYGNIEYVVNWENDGYEIINFRDSNGRQLSRPQNLNYNFKEGLTWTSISSGPISIRYSGEHMMYESKGSGCFPFVKENIYSTLSFLNSKIGMHYISAIAPTLDYSEGSLLKLPFDGIIDVNIDEVTTENIAIAKQDWDSFENSWDFKRHPLV